MLTVAAAADSMAAASALLPSEFVPFLVVNRAPFADQNRSTSCNDLDMISSASLYLATTK